jgi:Rha family phage regulatory protein
MTELTTIKPAVFEHRGIPLTNSQQVAEFFDKEHRNVLRAYRDLLKSGQIERDWFTETTYIDEQGRTYPSVNMTSDGFTLLAMGFTGAEAIRCKVAYINQFNAMEAELTRPQAVPAIAKPRLSGALLREMAKTVDHMQDRFHLSPSSSQAFAASLYGAAGIALPEPTLAVAPSFTTTELAREFDMAPNVFGKKVKHLRTEQHGELRLTTASNGTQVPQFHWNQRGADAVTRLMNESLKVLPFSG